VTTTKQELKARRVDASITRGQLAEASGISQYKIDRIERGVDVGEDDRKAYDAGVAKLLAKAVKSSTNGTAKKTTARTRKAAQPKAEAESPAA
jgi:transcriptional regulator with XRE-family HTH domain